MPQLDQMSFMSQIFWFLLTFYTLYTFILIYLLPPIFRVLKYRVKKFEILIAQINFLNLSTNQGNINYINVLNTFITSNLKILINYKKNYNLNLQTNQKDSYNNLNNISHNVLEQLILRKINL